MLIKNVNRLDHIAILVKAENVERYKTLISATLGVAWDEAAPNESAGVMAVPSWDAGLELIAPLRPSGTIWDRIQRWGEGTVTIVFGVEDMDKAVARATANGGQFLYNIEMEGTEPWLKRFETFKETKVKIFPDDFAATVTLGEITPAIKVGSTARPGSVPQFVNRLDHIAMIVRPENIEKYQKLLTDTLGVTWDETVINESAGVIAAPSWDAGLEFIAPMRESGTIWDRLQRWGEGSLGFVFGVPDIDQAVAHATANGGEFLYNLVMHGDEPWLKRFKTFKESKVRIFPDDFAATLTLGQLEPV